MPDVKLKDNFNFKYNNIKVLDFYFLPIFTETWFSRVEGFVKEEYENYSIYKLLPEKTDSEIILKENNGYIFVMNKDNKLFARDMGGESLIKKDVLKCMELVFSTN